MIEEEEPMEDAFPPDDGEEDPECGIFVTLNPQSDYEGYRSEDPYLSLLVGEVSFEKRAQGRIVGYLIDRDGMNNAGLSFCELCESDSSALQAVYAAMFDDKGRCRLAGFAAADPVHEGKFLYITSVSVEGSAADRAEALSKYFMQVQSAGLEWTIAAYVPDDRLKSELEHAFEQTLSQQAAHREAMRTAAGRDAEAFARVGFVHLPRFGCECMIMYLTAHRHSSFGKLTAAQAAAAAAPPPPSVAAAILPVDDELHALTPPANTDDAAQWSAYEASATRLVQAGASVDRSRALHVAAGQGSANACKLLCRLGGNVNLRDDAQNTPLMVAVIGSVSSAEAREFCVAQLLESGADRKMRNARGLTPLDTIGHKQRAVMDIASMLGFEAVREDAEEARARQRLEALLEPSKRAGPDNKKKPKV